jgi:hypothetical protein
LTVNEQQKEQQARTGLFRAGTVAVWVWVAVTALPILACVGCCGFSLIGSAINGGAEAAR